MTILTILVRILAGLLILATGLSIIESNEWWIRIWDFPRAQILAGLILACALSLWSDRSAGKWIAIGCVIAANWQLYRIYPYTPLADREIAFAGTRTTPHDRCFSVLALNVLDTNRDYARTIRLINRRRPDILLLTETDPQWAEALADALSGFPHILSKPLNNGYGMIFATRLPMRDGRFETIAEADTPSISATLTARDAFRVIGLHPRPPLPGQDTDARDAEIAIAARRAAREQLPVLAIGDFNDVAWSHTAQLFKRTGGYLDPRIGRGTYATFPAQFPILGWPLDHLYVTPEFQVRSMDVLDNVGSDHLPIHAELCLTGQKSSNARRDPVSDEDRRDVKEVLEGHRDSKE
ncbi:endonuclease/exonuclease/phosphatase family protein [Sphingomonas suaedae]|uniref:endonuclease/exonuclease/phosphatase family protein n=1 Tax=Sphingomonas suaedae TaxID=2599297 RepID=UPI0016472697|nr:endonuclease/exonuclease/phosphatase family protein [Sphingomonas suaedae]